MSKPMQPRWFLQAIANEEVCRLAPDAPIAPIVREVHDEIVWDEECDGLGRAPWRVDYFVMPGDPARALIPMLTAAMAPWRAKFDLGIVSDSSKG
jgi:hypothetical protein